MRGAPIHFDDLAFSSAIESDPIARPIRVAETENQARKNIVEGALQCEAQNDRYGAGRNKQSLNREIKHIGDDGENRDRIGERGKKVLNEFPLAWPAFEHDDAADQSDQEPSRPQPPRDHQRAAMASRKGAPVGCSGS